MTDKYTPMTAVRRAYCTNQGPETRTGPEFDRWLAAHDAEVRADAWDEGFYAGANHDFGDYEVAPEPIINPYRSAQNHTDGSERA